VIPIGETLIAEPHLTKGFAFRPGWHCCEKPLAPHLSKKDRVWCAVDIKDFTTLNRPESQGGRWYLSKDIKILHEL